MSDDEKRSETSRERMDREMEESGDQARVGVQNTLVASISKDGKVTVHTDDQAALATAAANLAQTAHALAHQVEELKQMSANCLLMLGACSAALRPAPEVKSPEVVFIQKAAGGKN